MDIWHKTIVSFRIENWDVDNENIHGGWFEEATGDDFILDHIFQEAFRLDPTTPLFLNDFAVVNNGNILFVSTLLLYYVILIFI